MVIVTCQVSSHISYTGLAKRNEMMVMATGFSLDAISGVNALFSEIIMVASVAKRLTSLRSELLLNGVCFKV